MVAAASEPGRAVTNGMSRFARDGENINGGFLVNVTPEDFGGGADPLAGVAFQRKLEEDAFRLGGGGFRAPAQRVEDFLLRRASTRFGDVKPSYRPGVTPANLWDCLPEFICEDLKLGITGMDRQLHGFALPDAVMTGVETRSSSPVRLPRSAQRMSNILGLYPVGEGAGYAGGIVSAAVDGIETALTALEGSTI